MGRDGILCFADGTFFLSPHVAEEANTSPQPLFMPEGFTSMPTPLPNTSLPSTFALRDFRLGIEGGDTSSQPLLVRALPALLRTPQIILSEGSSGWWWGCQQRQAVHREV